MAASLALAFSAAVPLPAQAVCDGCVVAAVGAAATAITQAIGVSTTTLTKAIATSTTTLVKLLTQFMLQNSGAISAASYANTQAVHGAANSIAQSAIALHTRIEMARNEQRYDVAASDVCSVLAPTLGVTDAMRSTATAFNMGGKGAILAPGGSKEMAGALNAAERRIPVISPEVELLRGAKGACASFVASDTARADACSGADMAPALSTGLPDADIRASTLFDGPQRTAGVVRRLTLDLDGADGTAVRALQRNLNNVIELKTLTKPELSSELGRQFIGLQDAFSAQMSVARYAQDARVNYMAAKPGYIGVLQQLLTSEDGPWITAYLSKNAPDWKSKGISTAEYLNMEVERRMMNANWHIRMARASPEEAAKEQIRMSALQLWIELQGLETQSVQAVVASNATASQIRSEFWPNLKAAHDRASQR